MPRCHYSLGIKRTITLTADESMLPKAGAAMPLSFSYYTENQNVHQTSLHTTNYVNKK